MTCPPPNHCTVLQARILFACNYRCTLWQVDTPNDHIVIGAPGRVRSPGAFLGGIYTHIVDTMDFPEFTSYVPPITNPQAAQHAGELLLLILYCGEGEGGGGGEKEGGGGGRA